MRTTSRYLLPLAALVLAACGGAPDDPREDDLLRAILDDDTASITAQLHPDTALVTPDGRITDPEAVAAYLVGLPDDAFAAPSTHHDVWRAALVSDEGAIEHLFARRGGDGELLDVVHFTLAEQPPSAAVVAYQHAWNTSDLDDRAALLEDGFHPEGRYVDPGVDATGRAALSDAITAFQGQLPGASIDAEATLAARAGPWVLFGWGHHRRRRPRS
jgi:hypothetical protein